MTGAGCSRCARQDETDRPDDVPLGWSADLSVDPPRLLCPACTREHARSIEAKLDEEFWS